MPEPGKAAMIVIFTVQIADENASLRRQEIQGLLERNNFSVRADGKDTMPWQYHYGFVQSYPEKKLNSVERITASG